MKKRFGVTVLALGASVAIILSGCGGCAGCGTTAKNIASLSSNWYANTAYKKIQPTFTQGNEDFKKEEIKYTVTFDKTAAKNNSYSVNYSDGTYITEFYAAEFDRDKYCAEEFKDAYPDNLVAYYYKTSLNIPEVTFKVGNDEKSFENDSIITECWFLSVEDALQPIYSKISADTVSPAANRVSSIDEAYNKIKCEYVTYYSYQPGAALIEVTCDGQTTKNTTDGLGNTVNTVFDLSSLNIAIRATKLTGDLSQVITLHTPNAGLQNFTLSGRSGALSEADLTKIENIMTENGLYVGGNEDDKLNTTAVSITYAGQLSGVSQQYWFAAIDNARNNTGRATMLKIAQPLPYSLGTLHITLDEIVSKIY